ncbi:hypothetical protein PGH45_09485 [Legionella pneumophila]|nr:hypothetical protein [Legionella pneumophila]
MIKVTMSAEMAGLGVTKLPLTKAEPTGVKRSAAANVLCKAIMAEVK